MNGIVPNSFQLLLSAAQGMASGPSGLDLLALEGERSDASESRKRKIEEEEDPAAILSNLSKVAYTIENRYETEIAAPFLLRVETLIVTMEEFEQRLFSPTPPNNKSKIYREWLEEEVWEYDLIIDWLGSQFKCEVAKVKYESPHVYRFLKENLKEMLKGMDSLYERYEDLHGNIVNYVKDFRKDLEQFSVKMTLNTSDFNKSGIPKDKLIESYEDLFERCEEGKGHFSYMTKCLKRDLRTMQGYFQASASAYQTPFSLTHAMAFPYIAEDRYYYLSPPSPDAENPRQGYDIIQEFFKGYQKSFCMANNNHFQFLLARTIEMKNMCEQVFRLREDVVSALKAFSENL